MNTTTTIVRLDKLRFLLFQLFYFFGQIFPPTVDSIIQLY